MKTKTCTKCGIEKPIEEFAKSQRHKSGKQNACKKCMSGYRNKWRADNLERVRIKNKEWRENNKEKIRLQERRYAKTHRDKKNKYQRKYYKSHRDTIRERAKRKYKLDKKTNTQTAEDKEKRREYLKKYYEKNKERIKARTKLYIEKNRAKVRRRIKTYNKKIIQEARPFYIKSLLTKNNVLKAEDIPQELIELKKLHLTLIREARKWNNQQRT